jgi:hypothetical protein
MMNVHPNLRTQNAEKARQIAEWDRNPQKQAEDGDPFGDGDQSPLKGQTGVPIYGMHKPPEV